jgi:hypothetical protein
VSIKAGWINILETSLVTVTSADPNYPAYRLYDGYLGKMWKSSAAAWQNIIVDQAGANLNPSPNDFTGWNCCNCTVAAGDIAAPDGSAMANKITRTATGNHFINRGLASQNTRGKTYTACIWLELGSLTGNIVLRMGDSNTEWGNQICTATPGGWQRFSVTETCPPNTSSPTTFYVSIDPQNDSGAAGDTFYAWGLNIFENLNIQAIDSLIIPSGHNLVGTDLAWQYFNEDTLAWTTVDYWTQADGNLIVRRLAAPAIHRRWLLAIINPVVAPQMGELYMTLLNSFSSGCQPQNTNSQFGTQRNASRIVSKSNVVQFVSKGAKQRFCQYQLPSLNPSDTALLQAWDDAFDGRNPFFFIDHAGNMFFAELIASSSGSLGSSNSGNAFIAFTVNETVNSANIAVLEVLG